MAVADKAVHDVGVRPEPHLCAAPGCKTIIEDGPGRCPEHRHNKPGSRGYGSRWRRLRASYIRQQPLCEEDGCDRPAVEVHHRDHRGPNGPRFYDRDNLQALCAHLHRTTTQARRKTLRSFTFAASRGRASVNSSGNAT